MDARTKENNESKTAARNCQSRTSPSKVPNTTRVLIKNCFIYLYPITISKANRLDFQDGENAA
jgi:hypothetical protein